MLWVTKASGLREKFEKQKIVNTCLRMGASLDIAEEVADEVYKNSYEGIPTSEILTLVFEFLSKYKPEVKLMIDLREAIAKLKPKPDFEQFVRRILGEYSYEVEPAQIIRGKCIEHEIDGIVKKGNEVLCLEVKHHFKFHTPTPLEVPLSVWATFQDIKDGFKLGYHKIKFTGALIVCNTKFSLHAKNYALCKGIRIISWDFPSDCGLRDLIRNKKIYPITMLKELDEETQEKLVSKGIITLKDLVEADSKRIPELIGIEKEKVYSLMKMAEELLRSF
jgi:hypothetical protein